MTDQEFLEKIYSVASNLKGRTLSDQEKTRIITYFNNTHGSNYERAKEAIKNVTGEDVPTRFLSLESAGSINNLEILVAEMKAAANEWKKDG